MLRLLLRRKSWTTESAFAASRPANCNAAFNRGCLLKRQSRNSSGSHFPHSMTSKSSCARSIRIVFQALGYPLPRSPTPATNTFVGLLSGARFIARRLGYDDQIHGMGRILRDVEVALVKAIAGRPFRSEEHTSELQSLMRISYAVFCLKKKKN